MSSRPTGQQQRKPVGRKFATGVAEGPGVVDWRTWGAAEKRRRRLVGRGRPSTAAPDHVGNCAPWRRACTWLAQARWASAVWCAVSVTVLGRTCVCQVITRATAFITRWSLSVVTNIIATRKVKGVETRSGLVQAIERKEQLLSNCLLFLPHPKKFIWQIFVDFFVNSHTVLVFTCWLLTIL